MSCHFVVIKQGRTPKKVVMVVIGRAVAAEKGRHGSSWVVMGCHELS